MMWAMLGRLRALDIVAEEEPEDSPVLGFVLQDGRQVWAPTANKFWRLAYTFEEAGWGRRHFSGKEVSRMLGHAASLFGLRHELFAVFFRAYAFAQENDGRRQRLWRSVRQEFRLAWSLLPFAAANAARHWRPRGGLSTKPAETPASPRAEASAAARRSPAQKRTRGRRLQTARAAARKG